MVNSTFSAITTVKSEMPFWLMTNANYVDLRWTFVNANMFGIAGNDSWFFELISWFGNNFLGRLKTSNPREIPLFVFDSPFPLFTVDSQIAAYFWSVFKSQARRKTTKIWLFLLPFFEPWKCTWWQKSKKRKWLCFVRIRPLFRVTKILYFFLSTL